MTVGSSVDELSQQLISEAQSVLENEPELCHFLHNTVLAPNVKTFEDAVAHTVCYRLLLQDCNSQNQQKNGRMFCPATLQKLLRSSMDSDVLELGHTMKEAIREDAMAVCQRDPAMDTVLEVVLFSKGYAALVCHRAAFRLWEKRKFTSLFLQSQCSAVFGLDIHPRSRIGMAIMFDHGTGIVIGETATIGDGSTLLHGVTLGGTGKDHGDRHPKVGPNVLIGAGASLLGNIHIGEGCKIGAGSVVLRNLPPHCTAVGAPAKIIGRPKELKPGSEIDETLQSVELLHKSRSAATVETVDNSSMDDDNNSSSSSLSSQDAHCCPYRDYARMSKHAPPNTLTICALHKLLSPWKCGMNEIGACFFDIDARNVGYVRHDVVEKKGADAILEHFPHLEKERVQELVDTYLRKGIECDRVSECLDEDERETLSREMIGMQI